MFFCIIQTWIPYFSLSPSIQACNKTEMPRQDERMWIKMANKTANYQLNQWEAKDSFLRADFNEDNAKIDAALTALKASQVRIVHGSYTGNGADTQFIALEQMPQMLIVTYNGRTSQGNIMYGGTIYPGAGSEAISLTDTGFTAKGGSGSNQYRGNLSGNKYHYLAIYWEE